MTVDVYLCEKFKYTHERKAFGPFLQEMLDRYSESPDHYLIIGEPETNTASIDLIILNQYALIAVEFKELTQAAGVDLTDIYLTGTEKGAWEYRIENGYKYTMGGAGKDQNPYQQVKYHHYKLQDWLVSHSEYLSRVPLSQKEAFQKIYSWVVISPGFNDTASNIDLPWKEIRRWFKLLTIEQLAYEVGSAANEMVELTPEQMVGLAKQLGAVRRENLLEFVPNYVPPAPRLSFFSRLPICKRIVDRNGERSMLINSVKDPQVSILCIGGPGGIGKSYIATWLSDEVKRMNYKVLWIECKEREVTQESFLSAVADKMPDKYQAALIHDPEQRSSDKIEIALEFLDQEPHLLIFDDYHRISKTKGLNELFTLIIHKTTNIKILLTTRVRPECLDSPEWTPGSVAEIALGGLPYEVMHEYLPVENLNDDQLKHIWERTSGNPYAIGLFTSMLRNRWREEDLAKLPLFNDDDSMQWARSLINTLSGEVRIAAMKIAVVRTHLNIDLIERITYSTKEKVFDLIRELIDQYILYEAGADLYAMHDYVREALISNSAERDLQKAHQTAGRYFENIEQNIKDEGDKIEILLQALYHYGNGQSNQDVSNIAPRTYNLLISRGDNERAYNVACQAVSAARGVGRNDVRVEWMVKQIKQENELRRLDDAKKHIHEALNLIPKSDRKHQGAEKAKWLSLEARCLTQAGWLAHLNKDHVVAAENFQQAVDLASRSEDNLIIAETLFEAARIERLSGDYIHARQHFEVARSLASELGNDNLSAKCISHLGLIARDQGDFEEARSLFALAQEKAENTGNLHGQEIASGLLGDIYIRLQDYEEAEAIFRARLSREKAHGNKRSIRINMGWLVDALIGSGKLAAAEELLLEYKQLCDKDKDEIGEAFYYKRMGQIIQGHGHMEEGSGLIQIGIQKLQETGNQTYIPDFKKALIKHPVPKQFTFWDDTSIEIPE